MGIKTKDTFIGFGFVLAIIAVVLVIGGCANSVISEQQLSTSDLSISEFVIDVDQAYQLREEGAILLDVRRLEEWNQGHIPGAVLIPLDELQARISELPVDQDIVIYCRIGNRSALALSILHNTGFSTVYSMTGGINDWIYTGYPVE